MIWLFLALTLQTCRAGPSLWPFILLFWGLVWLWCRWEGWL
jgi:hypothetical protein